MQIVLKDKDNLENSGIVLYDYLCEYGCSVEMAVLKDTFIVVPKREFPARFPKYGYFTLGGCHENMGITWFSENMHQKIQGINSNVVKVECIKRTCGNKSLSDYHNDKRRYIKQEYLFYVYKP